MLVGKPSIINVHLNSATMESILHTKERISSFNMKELFSIKRPLAWYIFTTSVLLVCISIGNNNEMVFFSLLNLSRATAYLNPFMELSAKYLFILIIFIALGWYGITQKGKYLSVGVTYAVVGLIAYLLSKGSTHIIIDPRPYLQYHLTPLISVAKDNGFPSDHTLLSMAIASVTSLYSSTMGWVLFILSFIVGFARIYVAAHHPLDVIGSMVIVAVSILIFIGMSLLIQKRLMRCG